VLAVAALTAIAFALRYATLHDSLAGDELFMFRIVHGNSLRDALHIVRETEKTPPLFFVLVWGAAKLGDPTVWLRVPSLVFGTLLVPVVYAHGRPDGRRARGRDRRPGAVRDLLRRRGARVRRARVPVGGVDAVPAVGAAERPPPGLGRLRAGGAS
jgi:hypothetical protein